MECETIIKELEKWMEYFLQAVPYSCALGNPVVLGFGWLFSLNKSLNSGSENTPCATFHHI